MLDDRISYISVMIHVAEFLLPLVAISLFVSLVLIPISLYNLVRTRTAEATRVFGSEVLFVLSFCIVGFVVGLIIRLLGGFSLGTSESGGQPDTFQFIATLAASFAAITGLFLGEAKLHDATMVRPVGAGAAILMMMVGYLYLGGILAEVEFLGSAPML
ncbi:MULTISPECIES: hypothetical protein [Devosia]|uniref:hypothetical protein n=1 Tax=Devosia TaxID=46913 RepID=UPI00273308E8|nr:hypothetical protein [Devosia sp.]MDP2781553.1 hypothetical protein [Devosia sp.]